MSQMHKHDPSQSIRRRNLNSSDENLKSLQLRRSADYVFCWLESVRHVIESARFRSSAARAIQLNIP